MKKALPALCVLGALVFLAIAIYYWTTKAGSLPSWVPGHEAGSSHIHLKHGLAALVVAIAFAVLAWFTSAKKTTSPKSTESK
jgi:hypothetical protein